MSTNKDLLKQAIAEAKTIREAAIANAKEALEESLTPHLKEMLAQKLQEMEEDENEKVMDENIYEVEEEEVEAEESEEEETEEAEEEETEEAEEEELDLENMSVEEFKDLVRDIVAQEVGHEESEEEMPGQEAPEAEDMVGMGSEEEIDINELLAELADMEDESYSPEVEEEVKPVVARETAQQREQAKELEEALQVVAELRKQLQEVNLLNAKLLYVNKVFKANNLTESQKVNVVAAFDRAETVKEVKLVFETVSKNVVTKPVAIKEHKSFASKPAGTAATAGKKEIISEVTEQVARWQKLAGIIK